MLCGLAEGIRECVGLLVGKASVDQATGNRMRIEHKVMLPRRSQLPVVDDPAELPRFVFADAARTPIDYLPTPIVESPGRALREE